MPWFTDLFTLEFHSGTRQPGCVLFLSYSWWFFSPSLLSRLTWRKLDEEKELMQSNWYVGDVLWWEFSTITYYKNSSCTNEQKNYILFSCLIRWNHLFSFSDFLKNVCQDKPSLHGFFLDEGFQFKMVQTNCFVPPRNVFCAIPFWLNWVIKKEELKRKLVIFLSC